MYGDGLGHMQHAYVTNAATSAVSGVSHAGRGAACMLLGGSVSGKGIAPWETSALQLRLTRTPSRGEAPPQQILF